MSKLTENTRRSAKIHQHHVTVSADTVPASQRIDAQVLDHYDPNDDFDPEQELYGDPMDGTMDKRVLLAQERLVRLRKEADDIEREKHALEDLRRKQQEFMQGRTEMVDRLSRAVALLDRESTDSRRKIEQMIVMRECFAEHMEAVHGLAPEDWSRHNLAQELSRALCVIDDAKMEYDRSMTRLQAFTQAVVAPVAQTLMTNQTAPAKSLLPVGFTKAAFLQCAFYGFAFAAPLIVVLALFVLAKFIF